MTDFKELIGIPRSGETAQNPRVGVAPFSSGIKNRYYNKDIVLLGGETMPTGSYGTIDVVLVGGISDGELKSIDKAFTIDISGNITSGNVAQMTARGLYRVSSELTPTDRVAPTPMQGLQQKLLVNMWLENTEPIFTQARRFGERKHFTMSHQFEDGEKQFFFLPADEEILKALRVSIKILTYRGGEIN